MSDYARLVNERAHALAEHIVRVLDGLVLEPIRAVDDAQTFDLCDCPPCPGRGNDGHGMTHCAECCFGSGVVADIDCPTHGAQTIEDEEETA